MALTPSEIKKRKAKRSNDWYHRTKRETGTDPVSARARWRKAWIVGLTEGCSFCGYFRCVDNIVFHHLFDKKFVLTIKTFQRSSKNLVAEIRKCIPCCHNCHGEIHAGLILKSLVQEKHQAFVVKFDSQIETFLSP